MFFRLLTTRAATSIQCGFSCIPFLLSLTNRFSVPAESLFNVTLTPPAKQLNNRFDYEEQDHIELLELLKTIAIKTALVGGVLVLAGLVLGLLARSKN